MTIEGTDLAAALTETPEPAQKTVGLLCAGHRKGVDCQNEVVGYRDFDSLARMHLCRDHNLIYDLYYFDASLWRPWIMEATKKHGVPLPPFVRTTPIEVISARSLAYKYGTRRDVTVKALQNAGYLSQALPRSEFKQTTYEVLKPFPSDPATIAEMVREANMRTFAALFDMGAGEVESLQEEMQSWHDGMPENLQNGSKGDDVQTCADELTNLCDTLSSITLPEYVEGLQLAFYPQRSKSRSDRLGEAQAALDTLKGGLEDWLDANRTTAPEDQIDEIQEIVDGLGEVVDGCSNISFPGMY